MRSRFMLLAVALPVLAAAPVAAQTTTFFASGGDVTFNPTGLAFTPFQLFATYLGHPNRLILSSDGTSVTLDTKGTVGITGIGSLGSLDLGPFAAGSTLVFTYMVDGVSYSAVDFYLHKTGGYNVQYSDYDIPNSQRVSFEVRGISSATGLQCPGGDHIAICSDVIPGTPVTSTPEPGTWALMATGLAGLIPVVRRRRSVSPS